MPPRKKNTTKTTKKATNSTETRHAVTVRIPSELHGVHASLANANRFNKVITELLRMYSNVREVQEYINAQLSSSEQKAEDATKRLVQVLNAPMFVDSDTPDSANNSQSRCKRSRILLATIISNLYPIEAMRQLVKRGQRTTMQKNQSLKR